MTPLEIMEARLTELRKESDALYEQRGALIDKAAGEKRAMTDVEQAAYDEAGTKRSVVEKDLPQVEARVLELREQTKREAIASASRLSAGETSEQRGGGAQITDPEVYAKGNTQRSFLRDLGNKTLRGDSDASERLRRHSAAMADTEKRALGNTNATGGSGGELAPPEWLINDYIKLVRPGRITADLFTKSDVPSGVSNINIPRILTGTSVAVQSTQNTALSQTDMTTGFVSTGFTTIGGKQVVSQQLLDQTALNFDQVVLQDLAAAYATTFGQQVIFGAGTGANNNSVLNGLVNAPVSGANAAVFTSASPTAALLYSKLNGMLASFVTQRFAPPEVWLMHPRRWYWLLAQVDSQGRPLVVPTSVAYNPVAMDNMGIGVQGSVGVLLGLPVVIDPNLPINLGAGTNQDEIFLMKTSDLWLFESTPQVESFRETYSDSVGVLFRIYNYAGTILNRYSTSIATLNGTGLVSPVF